MLARKRLSRGVLEALVWAIPVFLILPLAICISLKDARADSARYRLGSSIGFGGSGLSQVTSVQDNLTVVERSEGPAVLSLFADRLLTDYLSLGLEHTRGINFAPFSMGSSFSGFTARWYFWGPAASVASVEGDKPVLLIRRFTPYIGGAVGAAMATIRRENDLVPLIEGSGVYFGLRIGADYPLAPGLGLRPELIYSTTIFQSSALSSSLSEYSIGCGIFILL
jgi:hypothetical protein